MTRADLPPGDQAVQAAHAGLALAAARRELFTEWEASFGSLVMLAAADELTLCWLLADAEQAGHVAVPFREPDLDGALTAVALSGSARPLVSRFPLALRGEVRI